MHPPLVVHPGKRMGVKKNRWVSMAGTGGARPGAGRPRGRRNQRSLDGEAFARAILEDATVRQTLLVQAQTGVMSAEILRTLMTYAFGKPVEVIPGGDADSPRSVTITF
jgi:hypothetical protein